MTVNAGDGYTISSTAGSGLVSVADNDDGTPPNLPSVSIAGNVVTESAPFSLLEFRLTLSQASDENITVYYETREGTAQNHLDYQGTSSGRAVIYAGRTSGAIIVNVRDDHRVEQDETFELVLRRADGAVIADGKTTGTIKDND